MGSGHKVVEPNCEPTKLAIFCLIDCDCGLGAAVAVITSVMVRRRAETPCFIGRLGNG